MVEVVEFAYNKNFISIIGSLGARVLNARGVVVECRLPSFSVRFQIH